MALREDSSVGRSPFAVDVCGSDGAVLIALAGELDLSTAEELREQLAGPEVLSAREVRVDLSRTSFVDSVSIGVIVTACKQVRAKGGSFSVLCGARDIVRRVFEIDGLVDYLQLEATSGNRLTEI